jgi:hypothetical protein
MQKDLAVVSDQIEEVLAAQQAAVSAKDDRPTETST